jgi:hypothetical protein
MKGNSYWNKILFASIYISPGKLDFSFKNIMKEFIYRSSGFFNDDHDDPCNLHSGDVWFID